MSRPSAAAAPLLLLLALPGCYLGHVTAGQLEILCDKEPIEEVLARPDLDAETREKLELVQAARRYAVEEIGLQADGSYTEYYDTGGDPVAWNVSASAPDAFAPYSWSFPIVGDLPYKGYFAPEPAVAEARELEALDLDVLVLPVPAYSTLGWFDDPVFSSMLESDAATLVETVIHELAHATVFVEADAAFNETLATFVGSRGARDFFRARGGARDPGLALAEAQAHDERLFNEALGGLRERLWRIYEATGPRAGKLALKEQALADFRREYAEEIQPRLEDPEAYAYVADPEVPLNNAFVLALQRYHGRLDLFEALWERCERDLTRTVEILEEIAAAEDPRAALEARVGETRR